MTDPVVRPMSAVEFAAFRAETIREYAAQKVEAGEWAEPEAAARAERDTAELLPQAQDTPGMVLLTAEAPDGAAAGHIWVALRPGAAPQPEAWIYALEVTPEHRGHGYSRALLAAAEQAAAAQGATSIGLNVFGPNAVARRLYETSGYATTALQMTKPL